jgi:F-type H+-transporting ATPase subunit b
MSLHKAQESKAMLINWFTIGAQALNFLVLVWLMKRFLYKPILHAIDERESQIADKLANADKVKTEAQKESDDFKRKNSEFDTERASLMNKASEEAKSERQRLFDEARTATDSLYAKQRETLRSDALQLNEEVSLQTRREIFAITRKTLLELSGERLEERISDVFTYRLREMTGSARESLAKAIKSDGDSAKVFSAFDLSDSQRTAIQSALNESFSTNTVLHFETLPDLISGMELTISGQKVAWCISDYLGSLEKRIDNLLKNNDKPEVEIKS